MTTRINASPKANLYHGAGFNFASYILLIGTNVFSEAAPTPYSITNPLEPSQTAVLGMSVLGIAGLVLKARSAAKMPDLSDGWTEM